MERNVKYLIIGAGISGLTFANYADGDYLIVEKEDEVGGYCRTIKENPVPVLPPRSSCPYPIQVRTPD